MKQHQFGLYIEYLVLCTIGLLLLLGAINWFINPYGIYNSPTIEGLNALKPEYNNHIRIAKAYSVRKIQPRAICLGNSRAEVGIDPDHVGWAYTPVYNLGLSDANIYEMTRYLQHANAVQQLKEVVLMLDFDTFSIPMKSRPDFEEGRLAVDYAGQKNTGVEINDILATLFSPEALFSSIDTIFHQSKEEVPYLQNGMRNPTAIYVKGGYYAAFLNTAELFLENAYRPEKYPFENAETNYATFDCYRQILQFAYRDNIKLYMCISPCHVRQWGILSACGLWPKFEQWKRILVMINEEEALRAGMPPFPLWDFSVYNDHTTEAVPPKGDTETMMQWYWDSSHYKKELGDLMLDRVFDCVKTTEISYNDFGVLLTSNNIDEHLQKIRTDRRNYSATHPDDVAEIEKLLRLFNPRGRKQ